MKEIEKKEETVQVRDKFLDFAGVSTNAPLTKRLVITFVASVIAYFVLSAVDLSQYGETASSGLGLFVAVVIFMVFSGMEVIVSSLLMVFAGIALAFWKWSDVSAYLGSSQFYTMLGMVIVAMGCEFTPFGRRIAYIFLEKFGSRPVRLVIVFGIVTALVSAFVSNIATLILMSSIGASLLESMGEKPGESVIGRSLMVLIGAASMYGGCVLISGSPYGNTMAISMMENASGGTATITYAQWAFFGVIIFAVTIIPFCMIYVKSSGMKNSGYNLPPKEYYEEKLRELGPLRGSEVRWVIIVIVMVAFMIAGKSTSEMAMLFATISFLPVVGTTPVRKCLNRVPIHVLLCMGTIPMMSRLLTGTGVLDALTDVLKSNVSIESPILFSIAACLITGLAINVCVNASSAVGPSMVALLTPISMALGFNPAVVLLPTMLESGFFWAMGMNTIMLMNKGYGYWDDKDAAIPGYLTILFTSIVIPIICCGLCGVVGMSTRL